MTTPDDGSRRVTPTSDRPSGRAGAERPVPRQDPTLIRGDQPVASASRDRTDADDLRRKPAKTSAAAAFALVFGLAALFCALTAILSPAAVLFGLIGLVLGIAGIKMAKRPGVTGKGVAIGGLVTAVLGLLLGAVVLGGLAAVVNDEAQLDRIQGYIDDARANLPTGQEVRETVPGG